MLYMWEVMLLLSTGRRNQDDAAQAHSIQVIQDNNQVCKERGCLNTANIRIATEATGLCNGELVMQVEWEERWWEESDWAGMRELGAEKSGCRADGAAWFETWREAIAFDQTNGEPIVERSAHKWACDGKARSYFTVYEHLQLTAGNRAACTLQCEPSCAFHAPCLEAGRSGEHC